MSAATLPTKMTAKAKPKKAATKKGKAFPHDVGQRFDRLMGGLMGGAPEGLARKLVLVGCLRAIENAGVEPGIALDDAINDLIDLAEQYVRGELPD